MKLLSFYNDRFGYSGDDFYDNLWTKDLLILKVIKSIIGSLFEIENSLLMLKKEFS